MINVKMIAVPKGSTANTSVVPTGGVTYAGGTGSAAHAQEADHASTADRATFAEQAQEATHAVAAEQATYANVARALAEDGEAIKAFLRSDKPSTAQELITFLKGIAFAAGRGIDGQGNATLHNIVANGVESSDYHRGMVDGEGFGVYRDDTGMAVFEVDKLNVRRKATFAELEVKQLAFTTGDVGFTSASARLAMVKPSEDGDMYRCYFLAEDDDHAISNDWRVGDQAMCKTANLLSRTTKQASNRYYWRLVVNTGEETVSGKLYYFIDLSDIKGSLDLTIDGKQYACVGYDTSTENDAPQAEDDIIQLGSQTDPDRQYAYILYVSEGRRVDYAGINDFNLTTHIVNEALRFALTASR